MPAAAELWWVFPAAVAFSTAAVGAGVSGALFFSPFFMVAVGLTPAQAVGAGLLTEVFGMGNGLRTYVRQGVVDFGTARWLLVGSLPAVAAGALAAHAVPGEVLRGVLGAGILLLGAVLLVVPPPERCAPGTKAGRLVDRRSAGKGETVIRARDGTTYRYPTCWRLPGVLLAAAGGLLTGLVSAGLPEIATSQLVLRCRVPPRVAVATSVFTLAVTATVGAAIHGATAEPAWPVVVWSVPGVLLGSALGSRVSRRLSGGAMVKLTGALFGAVGAAILALPLLSP